MKMEKSFFNKLLLGLEHKHGRESEEVLTFKLMYISHCQNPYGKVTWSNLHEFWKKHIN